MPLDAAGDVLNAFIVFLHGIGRNDLAHLPLPLLAGLTDLERGHAPPSWLTPRRAANRPPPPHAVLVARALAVIAAELLIIGDVPHKQAFADVARVLRDTGLKTTANAVRHWRQEIMKGTAPAIVLEVHAMSSARRALLPEVYDREGWRRGVLDRLRELVERERARK